MTIDRQSMHHYLERTLEQLRAEGCHWLPVKRQTQAASTANSEPKIKQTSNDDSIAKISLELTDCIRCKLSKGRTNIVIGRGNPEAELMFVGEAPGRDEDLQGYPFVGKAGKLLDKIIVAMGFTPEEVYIANIIKCRPPNNRNPEEDEIKTCSPFLSRQIAVVQPKVLCTLGTFAAQTLLQTERRISDLRGRFQDFCGIPLMPTFHPAFLLRNPGMKRLVWQDVQEIATKLGRKPVGANKG